MPAFLLLQRVLLSARTFHTKSNNGGKLPPEILPRKDLNLIMSVQTVRRYLDQWGRGSDILEFDGSSATVELAAAQLGVTPGRIAKTLCFRYKDSCLLLVAAGDARIDNARFKAQFGCKATMLPPDEVLALTGHAVGGVCPFDIPAAIPVFADESLKAYDVVYPACGSSHSAISVSLEQLAAYTSITTWVDVCKPKESNA